MEEHDWTVRLTPFAARELGGLSIAARRRVARAIDRLAEDPRPPVASALVGRPGERIWRIRVGDYRVLYEIGDRELRVLVIAIGRRREVYRSR